MWTCDHVGTQRWAFHGGAAPGPAGGHRDPDRNGGAVVQPPTVSMGAPGRPAGTGHAVRRPHPAVAEMLHHPLHISVWGCSDSCGYGLFRGALRAGEVHLRAGENGPPGAGVLDDVGGPGSLACSRPAGCFGAMESDGRGLLPHEG